MIGGGTATPAPLARKAAGGVAWQLGSYGLSRTFLLIFTALLARLLTPSQFGLVALALLLVTYLEVVADLGVGSALVFDSGDRRRVDQAIFLSVVSALGMGGAVALGAPAVGAFFGRPDVVPLVRVLALALVCSGLAQVPDGLLRRDLRFSRRLATEIARTMVQGTLSVGLAFAGFGAWSVVWGYVAGQAARAVVAWAVVSYRPSREVLRPAWPVLASLLSYGTMASGAALLLTLVHDVDYLIVGRIRGVTDLGYYSLAFRIPQTAVISVFWAISSVTFPVFARIRQDPSRVRAAYLRWVQMQTLFGFPAGLTLAAVAPALVDALFGPQWGPAAGALRALGIYSAVRSLSSGSFEVFKGMGRQRLALGIAAAAIVVAVPALTFAAHHGIVAVGWAQVALSGAMGLTVQTIGCRLLGVSLADLFRTLLAPVATGAAAAAAAGALILVVPGSWPALVSAVVGAGLASLLAAHLVRVDLPVHIPVASRWLGSPRRT